MNLNLEATMKKAGLDGNTLEGLKNFPYFHPNENRTST